MPKYLLREIGQKTELKDKKITAEDLTDATEQARDHGEGYETKIGVIDEAGVQVFTVVCTDEPVVIPDEDEEEGGKSKTKTTRKKKKK